MASILRTFVALELPETAIAALRNVEEGLRRHRFPFRWVSLENIHLTLKFLGETPADRVEDIGREIAQRIPGIPSVALSLHGVGTFPGLPKPPRVLWVGLAGETETLLRLQAAVEAGMESLGWPPERRSFRPHLTLARAKRAFPRKPFEAALAEFREFSSPEFVLRHLVLFQSILRPTGAVYTPLAQFELA